VPELPDIEVYIAALGERIIDETLTQVRLASPFLVRSYDPPLQAIEGRRVLSLRRLGKRIVRRDSEVNYCAGCQTGGKLLADRALSKLLKSDWPKTLDELEQRLVR